MKFAASFSLIIFVYVFAAAWAQSYVTQLQYNDPGCQSDLVLAYQFQLGVCVNHYDGSNSMIYKTVGNKVIQMIYATRGCNSSGTIYPVCTIGSCDTRDKTVSTCVEGKAELTTHYAHMVVYNEDNCTSVIRELSAKMDVCMEPSQIYTREGDSIRFKVFMKDECSGSEWFNYLYPLNKCYKCNHEDGVCKP